jgi:hypothetical protein
MTFSPGKIFRAATRHWLGPFARSRRVVKVTVRDEDFHVVRVLESEPDLAAFCTLFSALIEVDPRSWPLVPGRRYRKLDVLCVGRDGRTRSGRWLYHPGGFVIPLAIWPAIWIARLYRTPALEAFEELLRPEEFQPAAAD